MHEGPTTAVVVKGFTWAAAAGWSTFALAAGTVGLFMRQIGFAKLYEIWVNRDKSLRDDKAKVDMSNAQEIASLRESMQRASGAIAFLATAITTAVNGLASDDPIVRGQAATQAKELVSMAVSTLGAEDPFAKALDRMASIPPVDRKSV